MKKFLLSLFACVAALGMNAQTNLLTNGDFETWENGKATNWNTNTSVGTVTINQSGDSKEGDYAAELVWGGAKNNKRLAYKELNLKAGTYTFTYSVMSVNAEALGKIAPGFVRVIEGIVDSDHYQYRLIEGSEKDILYTEVPSDWTTESIDFTLEENTTIHLVMMVHKSGLGNVLIDDVSLTTKDGGIDDSVVEEQYEAEGEGTLANPYTITDVKNLVGKSYVPTASVWVKGTIVGTAKTGGLNETAVASNIALGTEEAYVPVELPSNSDIRKALNLVDNADNLGKEVYVYGNLTTYFGIAGVKGTTDWSFDGLTTTIATATANLKNATIFDLSGRRVNRAENGVFILNGKKVIR